MIRCVKIIENLAIETGCALKFELLQDGRTAKLIEDFNIKIKDDKTITIPIGFETDFASVPRLFWSLMPPWGRYSVAAVVHDYLYNTQETTRLEADKLFEELMEELDVSIFKRKLMYWGVRIGGRIKWNKSKNVEIAKKLLILIILFSIGAFYMPDNKEINFKDYYMGVKIVCAEPTSLINDVGYIVRYSDGDSSWVKEYDFNRMYIPLGKYCNDIKEHSIDKISEYFIRNLRVTESMNDTRYYINTQGGNIQYFNNMDNKDMIKDEVTTWIKFMIDWAVKGIDKNSNFIPPGLNEYSNYYLGAKIVQAKKSDSNINSGYIIRYPEGDIGWVDEEYFNKVYIKIGDNNDIYKPISKEVISKFNIYKEKIDIKMALDFIKEWGLFGIKETMPYNANLL